MRERESIRARARVHVRGEGGERCVPTYACSRTRACTVAAGSQAVFASNTTAASRIPEDSLLGWPPPLRRNLQGSISFRFTIAPTLVLPCFVVHWKGSDAVPIIVSSNVRTAPASPVQSASRSGPHAPLIKSWNVIHPVRISYVISRCACKSSGRSQRNSMRQIT